MTTTTRPESVAARRSYRRELRDAVQLGVPKATVAMVVDRFRGENPDPDDLHAALMAYVPVLAFSAGHDDTGFRR
jgi:hypothetical protein